MIPLHEYTHHDSYVHRLLRRYMRLTLEPMDFFRPTCGYLVNIHSALERQLHQAKALGEKNSLRATRTYRFDPGQNQGTTLLVQMLADKGTLVLDRRRGEKLTPFKELRSGFNADRPDEGYYAHLLESTVVTDDEEFFRMVAKGGFDAILIYGSRGRELGEDFMSDLYLAARPGDGIDYQHVLIIG